LFLNNQVEKVKTKDKSKIKTQKSDRIFHPQPPRGLRSKEPTALKDKRRLNRRKASLRQAFPLLVGCEVVSAVKGSLRLAMPALDCLHSHNRQEIFKIESNQSQTHKKKAFYYSI